MLNNLKNTISSLAAINWLAEMQNIVTENVEAIDALQQQQFAAGVDSNGDKITLEGNPFYQPSTIKTKKRKGQPFDVITLHDTGTLYNSIQTGAVNGSVFFKIGVSYFTFIERRTTDVVLGLNLKNREQFAMNIVLPALQDLVRIKLNLQ